LVQESFAVKFDQAAVVRWDARIAAMRSDCPD
jgi:hypothetical protein